MSAHAQPGALPPPVAMLDMIKGFWVSRALYVAAKLGIPDLLRDEPKSSDDLAQATGPTRPRCTGCCERWTVLGCSRKTIGDVSR